MQALDGDPQAHDLYPKDAWLQLQSSLARWDAVWAVCTYLGPSGTL